MELIKMPSIGLGTYLSTDEEQLSSAIEVALNAGYRHIDTASIYHNEQIIGSALKKSDINREEIFITTKIWNGVQTFDQTIEALEQSLQNLQTDYVDLVLIHWPKTKKRNAEVYKALEHLLEKGKVRAIGVSNFMINHLDDLLETANVMPMMNQVELHPYLQQHPLQEYCKEFNIRLTSYGPFAKGHVFNDEVLVEIAKKHKVSVSQVVVRWGVQREIFMIPKSLTAERIVQNNAINDFVLDNDDMKRIRQLNRAMRYYPSPDNIDF